MAISVTCPSCKQTSPATGASVDGSFKCPQCGSIATATTPASPKRQAVAVRSAPPIGARPQLLDRLPASPVMSPGFVAGAIAFVLAYGVAISVVISKTKRDPDPAEDAAFYASVIVAPEPTRPKAKVNAPETSKAVPTVAKATPTPAKANAVPTPGPPSPKPDTAKVAEAEAKAKEKATPKPKAKPKPKPIRTLASLKTLVDSVGDCKLIPDDSGLILFLPGKLHVLSPELATKNAPMALIDVEGNFDARVMVVGEVISGRTPVEKMPFAFHGAGLLLWKDKDNYLRLERAGAGASGHPHTHGILVEACKDGKTAAHKYVDSPQETTYLRLQRSKDGLRCSHSLDGETWVDDQSLEPLFPGKVGVGISASSTSKKPFLARFEEFRLAERPVEAPEPKTP